MQQLGMRPDQDEKKVLAADHPGMVLLRSILELGGPDAEDREAARKTLARDLSTVPRWVQAWAHYFIGVSLLSESGVGRQHSGLVNLAHVPARFAADQPYLAALALAKMAQTLDGLGDSAAAASLRAELASRFPHHPALASANRSAAPASRPSPSPNGSAEVGKELP
jgi:predicted DNA-binding transcriptional regulator YafY